MESGRGSLTALHLFTVWATMAAGASAFGFGLLMSGWGAGPGVAVAFVGLGAPALVGLLAVTASSARTVVPLCDSAPRRLGWAALVFTLGTLGVLAGLAAYNKGVDLGSGYMRFALLGVPYAVAAAFFVPGRGVRLGAVAVLVAGVAYGGVVGPAHEQQRQHEAEVARYRQNPELLYIGTAPPGMHVSRVTVSPAAFDVEYAPAREGYELGRAGLEVRPTATPMPRCPPPPLVKGMTCTVDAKSKMITIRDHSGGTPNVTRTATSGTRRSWSPAGPSTRPGCWHS